jgi:hypothetical protein
MTSLEKSIPQKENLAIGVSGCCDTAANTRCANLFLHGDFALSPTGLAEAVAQSVHSVVADNVGVTIVVQRFQKASRCAPTDPDCGPQLVGDGCLDKIHYDWAGSREPLFPEVPEPGDECAHDGDCFIEKSECQWICRGWRSFVPVWEAGGGCGEFSSRHWDSAICGCHNGRCALLYQEARKSSSQE